jgi:hypothetical protein
MQTIAGGALSIRQPWVGPALGQWLGVVALASCVLLAAAIAGPDASWDLRNYHLYNGYAWLHGRIGTDLDPAQMQTFYSPLLDIAYMLLLHAFNQMPRLLTAALAVPQAIAAVLVLVLARRLLPRWHAFAASLIGITGAAGLPTLGTAMSEMAPAACILGAVLLLIRADGTEPPGQACLAAGLLGGIAVGLKLTSAPYVLGLMAMAVISAAPGRRGRRALWFAIGALVAAGVTDGFWCWNLWQRFGNPVFPYFNDLFRSPWIQPERMADRRFMPRSIIQALLYPLFWALTPQTLVSELPMRDPRVALGWIAVLAIAMQAAWQRRFPTRGVAMLSAFWALSYVAWEVCFSILRYLATLELFSGILIMTALSPLLARMAREWQRGCSVALVLLLVAVTVYPDWGRASSGERAVSVALPPLPPETLVVLLDPSPMAYAAAFAPAGTRFVGANNNLVQPGDRNLLAQKVEAAIHTHSSPLWGLEMPRENPGIADATLRAYGLVRGVGCAPVRSNLDGDAILACPLVRLSPGTPEPPAQRSAPSRR